MLGCQCTAKLWHSPHETAVCCLIKLTGTACQAVFVFPVSTSASTFPESSRDPNPHLLVVFQLVQVVRNEGVKSLFKGAGANILRAVAGAGVLSGYDQMQVCDTQCWERGQQVDSSDRVVDTTHDPFLARHGSWIDSIGVRLQLLKQDRACTAQLS